jgi:ketosteroid isomerase-like protein
MRAYAAAAVLTVFLAATTACAPAADEDEPAGDVVSTEVDTEADMAAIDALRGSFAEALSAGDVDGMMIGYAEDAVQMPPNEAAVTGKDAIRARNQAYADQFEMALENPAVEILVKGDWAILRGTYVFSGTPKVDGEPIQETGRMDLGLRHMRSGTATTHRPRVDRRPTAKR